MNQQVKKNTQRDSTHVYASWAHQKEKATQATRINMYVCMEVDPRVVSFEKVTKIY